MTTTTPSSVNRLVRMRRMIVPVRLSAMRLRTRKLIESRSVLIGQFPHRMRKFSCENPSKKLAYQRTTVNHGYAPDTIRLRCRAGRRSMAPGKGISYFGPKLASPLGRARHCRGTQRYRRIYRGKSSFPLPRGVRSVSPREQHKNAQSAPNRSNVASSAPLRARYRMADRCHFRCSRPKWPGIRAF